MWAWHSFWTHGLMYMKVMLLNFTRERVPSQEKGRWTYLMDLVIRGSSYSGFSNPGNLFVSICTLDVFRIPCRLVIVANSERHSNKYLADTCIGNPVTQYYVHVVISPHSQTPFFHNLFFCNQQWCTFQIFSIFL